ncbi:D-fructose-6-phosphate amidotransferase [Photobacterium jeanii]|uniref:D-fructose-6-phosphate amidotransferase n=1 Tax=Photobacterium jeanii TaxID=858640 RepID=A0A178K7W0_9GAMM|nr:D-fructose-6-phosphate amidotransferase [Photobacterium jeanii]OAN13207.1 D-fructose-6-phosphate amidotransferase [Photobacterium jeanii]PST89358.1 D-fructose-6-phosphate amidotransferase [Photobacterium jeanii]
MSASKIYLRDILGLGVIILSVMAVIGTLFSILAMLNYMTHEDAMAANFITEAIPLLLCSIPAFILAKFINKPAWVIATDDFRLKSARDKS